MLTFSVQTVGLFWASAYLYAQQNIDNTSKIHRPSMQLFVVSLPAHPKITLQITPYPFRRLVISCLEFGFYWCTGLSLLGPPAKVWSLRLSMQLKAVLDACGAQINSLLHWMLLAALSHGPNVTSKWSLSIALVCTGRTEILCHAEGKWQCIGLGPNIAFRVFVVTPSSAFLSSI